MKLFLSALLLLTTVTNAVTAQTVRGLKKTGKSLKKAKKGKKGKEEEQMALVANLVPLGSGRVSLRFNPDDSMLVQVNAVNINDMCTTEDECLVVINEGTCDNVGEHFVASGYEDAWQNGDNYYTLDANGISRTTFAVSNGYGYDANKGKIVTLTDSSGVVWTCSVLMEESIESNTLTADMGVYPNYTGELTPSGTVTVTFNYDDTFKFEFNLEGLEENCVGCGIHIHAGVSCDTHEQIMGHGWNAEFVRDLWLGKYGAVYNTDDMGKSSSYFYLYNGWNIGINIGHVVVIHGQDGTRLGCGQLM